MNRKGRTSINVMAVAGPKREALALSVHASGRCHDAEVLRTSGLMETACFIVHNVCLLRNDTGDWLEAGQDQGGPEHAAADDPADTPDMAEPPRSPARAGGADRIAARRAGHRQRLAVIRHLRAARRAD
ncbi:hypothetical protein FJT64_002036 [Amphibalanus amphitrite]|uniref:DDE Tnp4 domain-containing protein n=1 Tax=Amphibalanus amphitrite TaxID=1232801 RepID=A0A6A4X773_AMPAM|nr:hypothetical protein FJT64_002036 [Amphibalanus amphitrite]